MWVRLPTSSRCSPGETDDLPQMLAPSRDRRILVAYRKRGFDIATVRPGGHGGGGGCGRPAQARRVGAKSSSTLTMPYRYVHAYCVHVGSLALVPDASSLGRPCMHAISL